MDLAITTDYHDVPAEVPRELQLQRIAAAGFRHVHWCWEWCTPTTYDEPGLEQARGWLAAQHLALIDTHACTSGEATEHDPDPARRARCRALHTDRLKFTAALGGDAIVLHCLGGADPAERLARMIATLRDLEPLARELGVALAVENLTNHDANVLCLTGLYEAFEPEVLGFCFDSGHANIAGDTDWLIEHAFPRLKVLHLHDNNGQADQHALPGQGTVDWAKVVAAIRATGYAKPINFEVAMREAGIADEDEFLAQTYERGMALFG